MKYVALLSGGKDSCYNLVHCARNGHNLVAAASLRPESGKEELDSYLYQTVGQDAIEFVTQALEIPLYRQVIQGTAIEQGSEYGGRNVSNAGGILGDETEDLYMLLSRVKDHHPDIKGVSVGAILSNYQRVRVEHVCRRLELTPLCYLWQRNQAELLDEMIQAGMEAILIKVAGIGLTKAHLGKTLAEMQPTLTKLNTLYGSHVCGEGGEYESLTLDCPIFKHRIVLTETETVIHSDNDFATVAFLRIRGAHLEARSTLLSVDAATVPSLLDEDFEAARSAVTISQRDTSKPPFFELHASVDQTTYPTRGLRAGDWLVVSNVQATQAIGLTLQEEVQECFGILVKKLTEHGLQLSNCTIINICISSMDLFLQVNAIYTTFFGVSPPARACVGVDLPEGIRVRLEAVAFSESGPLARQALHVQGLSYWAPANIGPYSQAIIAGERVFVSGQIGLIPSQLALPSPPSLATEMALSCQHISRVTSALAENTGGNWIGYNQLCIYWLSRVDDVRHVQRGNESLADSISEPVVFIVVKELPKGGVVEKQALLHTGRIKTIDDDDSEVIEHRRPQFEQNEIMLDNGASVRWETSVMGDGSAGSLIFVKGDISKQESGIQPLKSALSTQLERALSVRSFQYRQSPSVVQAVFDTNLPPITNIPCRRVASRTTDGWDTALCIISSAN